MFACLLGCASGDDPVTMPTTYATASATATAGPMTGTTGDATDATGGETAEPGDTSGEPPGTSTTAGSTTATTTTTDTGMVSEQPEDGMYSACDMASDCVGFTACLTTNDAAGQPIDPFCTDTCTMPLASCDPTPSGTAVPSCLEVDNTGTVLTVCVLDCSGGQLCPAGMECRTLPMGSICS